MIPVNLRMRNFMPYSGEAPELCFAPIHTACISGDNGAGKSSIIDAITWALWGKSRAGDKNQDALIHQGAAEVSVEFDFFAGGQTYRVVRKHALPKGKRASGQTSLDLFTCRDGDLTPISGDNQTQTQAKINNDILHMDYETFTNSAYLRQGHADEFTRQPAGKRKEVLANILGLAIYDTYEERAKNTAREAEAEKIKLSAAIGELESEMGQRAAIESEQGEVETQAAAINASVETKEKALKQLQAEVQGLEAVRAQTAQLDASIKRHGDDLKRESERLERSNARLAAYRALMAERDAIEEAYAALQGARAVYEDLNRRARQLSRLNERKAGYETKIAREQAELNKQHGIIASNIQTLEAKALRLPELRAEQQKLLPARQALEKLENEAAARRKANQQQQNELSRIAAETAGLKADIAAIDEKLKLLGEHEHGAVCPVCETELGEEKLEVVQGRYAAEKKQKRRQAELNEQEIAQLAAAIKNADAETARLELEAKHERGALDTTEGRLSQAMSEAIEASSRLSMEKPRLAEVEEALAARRYALPEQEVLSRIADEIAALAFDEKKLESVQEDIARLEGCEEQKRLLDEAMKLTAQEQESAVQAEKAVAEVKGRMETDNATRQTLAKQLAGLPEKAAFLERSEEEFKHKSDEQKGLRERLAVLKSNLAQLSEKETRAADKRKALAAAAENESIYKELARIFGKKGIQAMLIETALPEIEEEANRLLARMTDGRMSLTFETQELTKKGDIAETLDIKIADELGTRNYEMFSGGEAFRIDFSVRIALSRLLARRAGAPLPTLIIDEGFGTQDQGGIEKLKEAINSVQDDFQKILVITHIDELKDAFPTRIDVVKTADGSTIQMS